MQIVEMLQQSVSVFISAKGSPPSYFTEHCGDDLRVDEVVEARLAFGVLKIARDSGGGLDQARVGLAVGHEVGRLALAFLLARLNAFRGEAC
jgi:hypothetical protein